MNVFVVFILLVFVFVFFFVVICSTLLLVIFFVIVPSRFAPGRFIIIVGTLVVRRSPRIQTATFVVIVVTISLVTDRRAAVSGFTLKLVIGVVLIVRQVGRRWVEIFLIFRIIVEGTSFGWGHFGFLPQEQWGWVCSGMCSVDGGGKRRTDEKRE